MYAYIDGRPKVFTVADHRKGLVAKSREGCERTEDADKNEAAQFRSKQLPRLDEPGDHSNYKTTQAVDRQGPVREGRERQLPVHQAAESVAGQRPQETSRTDNDCVEQGRFQVFLQVCVLSANGLITGTATSSYESMACCHCST